MRKGKRLAILILMAFLFSIGSAYGIKLPKIVVSEGKYSSSFNIFTNVGTNRDVIKKTYNLKPWEKNWKKSSEDDQKASETKKEEDSNKERKEIKKVLPNAKVRVAQFDIIKYERTAKGFSVEKSRSGEYKKGGFEAKGNTYLNALGFRGKVYGGIGGQIEIQGSGEGLKRNNFFGARVGAQADLVLLETGVNGGVAYTDSRGITYGLNGQAYAQAGSFNRAEAKAGIENGQMIAQADLDTFTGFRVGGDLTQSVAYGGVKASVTEYGKVGVGLGAHFRGKVKISWSGISWDLSAGAYLGVGGEVGVKGGLDWGKALDPVREKANKGIQIVAQKGKDFINGAKQKMGLAKNQVQNFMGGIKNKIANGIANAKAKFNSAKQKIVAGAQNVIQNGKKVLANAKNVATGVINNTKNVAGQFKKGIQDAIKQKSLKPLKGVVGNVKNTVASAISSYKQQVKPLTTNIWSTIKSWF